MKYYTDGFTIDDNPSEYGGGYTVVCENGSVIEREFIEKKRFTCNEGEILGIWCALRLAGDGDVISTDSKCARIWALSGRSKARPDLNQLLDFCKLFIIEKHISLIHEGRVFNLAGIYNENHPAQRRDLE